MVDEVETPAEPIWLTEQLNKYAGINSDYASSGFKLLDSAARPIYGIIPDNAKNALGKAAKPFLEYGPKVYNLTSNIVEGMLTDKKNLGYMIGPILAEKVTEYLAKKLKKLGTKNLAKLGVNYTKKFLNVFDKAGDISMGPDIVNGMIYGGKLTNYPKPDEINDYFLQVDDAVVGQTGLDQLNNLFTDKFKTCLKNWIREEGLKQNTTFTDNELEDMVNDSFFKARGKAQTQDYIPSFLRPPVQTEDNNFTDCQPLTLTTTLQTSTGAITMLTPNNQCPAGYKDAFIGTMKRKYPYIILKSIEKQDCGLETASDLSKLCTNSQNQVYYVIDMSGDDNVAGTIGRVTDKITIPVDAVAFRVTNEELVGNNATGCKELAEQTVLPYIDDNKFVIEKIVVPSKTSGVPNMLIVKVGCKKLTDISRKLTDIKKFYLKKAPVTETFSFIGSSFSENKLLYISFILILIVCILILCKTKIISKVNK